MPDVYTTLKAEYAAAHTGAVVYDSSPLGRLRLTGQSRIDFLHRMSTNDMNALKPGQGAATILTTPIARIVDRVIVYVRENDALMLTSRGAQATVSGWLRKYIFFNDDVQVHAASSEYGMVSVYGSKAGDVVTRASGQDVSDLKLHHWRNGADGVLIARADPIAGNGFHLLAPMLATVSQLWQAAMDCGATPIGEQALEVLRIESGLPRYGRELSEMYLPQEVGLWADVSFSKGCYIGQEIIARMESRGRLAKQLVGLRAVEPFEADLAVHLGEGSIGVVSSVAARPGGDWIGLGFVKPDRATHGTRVNIGTQQRAADIVSLPISPRHL
ncbi:MAG TPA: glycine cleavage system protein T [Anaerolineae bacterium]